MTKPSFNTPGALRPHPEAKSTFLRVWRYDANSCEESSWSEELAFHVSELEQDERVLWIEVLGLKDLELIQAIGAKFGIHTLSLADTTNLVQRPKASFFDGLDAMFFRIPTQQDLVTTQCALVLGPRLVITFQNDDIPALESVRNRLREGIGRVRTQQADYLAFAILDASFTAVFPLLDENASELDELEDRALDAEDDVPETIHEMRRTLSRLTRILAPTRQAVVAWTRNDLSEIQPETVPFLRDLEDTLLHLSDYANALRERCEHLFMLHSNAVSMRMNEVMKVLTIIATIFMPLGFVAGLYGMNFNPDVSGLNMPETQWRYGYPFAIGLMGLIAAGLFVFFRKKRWL